MRSGLPAIVWICLACFAGLESAVSAVEILVHDEAGAPVSSAEIEVRVASPSEGVVEQMLSFRATATTNEDGLAFVTVPQLDGLLLFVDHEAFLPLGRELDAGLDVLRIELTRGQRITGRAISASTALADGAGTETKGVAAGGEGDAEPELLLGRVCASWREDFELWGLEKRWRRCVPLLEDGQFVLGGVADRVVEVGIAADGYLSRVLETSVKNLGDVPLERGIAIAGRVVSVATGQPIEGASVREDHRAASWTTSDEEGRFRLAVTSPEATLVAERPDYKSGKVVLDAAAHAGRLVRSTEKGTNEPRAALEIRLEPREGVTGLVIGPAAEPPAEVKLFFERRDGNGTSSGRRPLELDESGRFVAHLPSAGEYGFRISAKGSRSRWLSPVVVGDRALLDLGVIELDRGGRIVGRAAEQETGEPVDGAEVLLLEEGSGLLQGLRQRGTEREVTAADGSFELAGLSAGAFQLRLRHRDLGARLEQVALEPGEDRDLGTLWLRRGPQLRGRVVNRRGEPQTGVRIELLDAQQALEVPIASATTDSEGRFEGISVGAGSYRVNVVGTRLLASQNLDVSSESDLPEIELVTSGVELTGLIRRGGSPVEGGWITLTSALDPAHFRGKIVLHAGDRRSRYGIPESGVTSQVDTAGRFRAEDAPSGFLQARYLDPLGSSVFRQIRIPDKAAAFVEIELEGVHLSGRVMDSETRGGIAGAALELSSAGVVVATTRADSGGEFEFASLEPGTFAVKAKAEGYRSGGIQSVLVRQGAPVLEIGLRRGDSKSLRVEVRRPDGSPASGALLTLLDEFGLLVGSLPANASGGREFDRLRAGRYYLAWSDGLAGAGLSRPIDLRGDASSMVHRQTLAVGSPLIVTCDSGDCAGGGIAYLGLYTAEGLEISPYLSGVSPALQFSRAGQLQLGRLSPGRYLLRLGASQRDWQRQVEVTPGAMPVIVRLE